MPYKTKPKSRKRVTRSSTDRHIATIAKKTLMKVAEAKSYGDIHFRNATDDFFYYKNLISDIPQGSTSANRSGEQIFIKNLTINWSTLGYNTSTFSGDKICRIIIFETREALGLTNGTLSQSALFRDYSTGNASNGMIDFHKVKLLKDSKHLHVCQTVGVNTLKYGKMVIPYNKKVTFTQDSTGTYMKDKNLYVGFGYYSNAGLLAFVDFNFKTSITFNDS